MLEARANGHLPSLDQIDQQYRPYPIRKFRQRPDMTVQPERAESEANASERR
jgi:hypothetical protein